MAKKETTKPKSEKDDFFPLIIAHEARADMGIDNGVKACKDDKPEFPRKASKKRIPKADEEIVFEDKPDFGFVQDYAPFRNMSPEVGARLKKMERDREIIRRAKGQSPKSEKSQRTLREGWQAETGSQETGDS